MIIIFFDKSIVAYPNNNDIPIDAIPVPNCIIPIERLFIITNGDPIIPIIDDAKNPTQPAPVAKGTHHIITYNENTIKINASNTLPHNGKPIIVNMKFKLLLPVEGIFNFTLP